MDILQKELERKKKAFQVAKLGGGASRYVKAGELRRKQWEEEEKLKRSAPNSLDNEINDSHSDSMHNKKQKTTTDAGEKNTKNSNMDKQETSSKSTTSATQQHGSLKVDDEVAKINLQEVTEKLRLMGLPVRLFGEVSNQGDDSRRNRLRQALAQQTLTLAGLKEQDEFRLDKAHTIRNTFLEKEKVDSSKMAGLLGTDQRDDKGKKDTKDNVPDKPLPTDPYKRVYKYFKGLIREWEEDLDKRPEEVKRSIAGKNETKTMQQCRDYINPLFKQCKKREVDEGQLQNILKIIDFCIEGEFVKAHDAYMDVAIGRAAWPIGVTMVGIHARTGRSKIESQNVAHVMNSELQRKYLTSIKRLMTFAQSKRPDIHPSKKVVN